jgi:hypothetical protein
VASIIDDCSCENWKLKVLKANKCHHFQQIMGDNPQEKSRSYGRHFDASNELLSQISRKSIDVLKEYYRVNTHTMLREQFSTITDILTLINSS